MPERPVLRMSPTIIVVDLVGSILTGLGVWGLIDPTAAFRIGALAEPLNAALLVVCGLGMMGWAVFELLRRARPRR